MSNLRSDPAGPADERLRFSPLLPESPPSASSSGWQLEWLGAAQLITQYPGVVLDGRRVDGFEYQRGGRAVFLYPHDLVARLSSHLGQRLVMRAHSLHHVERVHGSDGSRNRFVRGISPRWLLDQLAARLPERITYEWHEARLDFDCGRDIGEDEVASMAALTKAGVLSRRLVTELNGWQERIVDLNLLGSHDEQRVVVGQLNRRFAGTPISLVIRRSSVLVQVAVAPRTTSWFSVVIFRDSRRPRHEGEVGEIRTLYPGRAWPPYPGGRWFFAHYAADRRSRGLAILERVRAGIPLDRLYQLRAVSAQRQAQKFWWEHATVRHQPPDDDCP